MLTLFVLFSGIGTSARKTGGVHSLICFLYVVHVIAGRCQPQDSQRDCGRVICTGDPACCCSLSATHSISKHILLEHKESMKEKLVTEMHPQASRRSLPVSENIAGNEEYVNSARSFNDSRYTALAQGCLSSGVSGNLEMSGNSCSQEIWLWQLNKITCLYFIRTVIHFYTWCSWRIWINRCAEMT